MVFRLVAAAVEMSGKTSSSIKLPSSAKDKYSRFKVAQISGKVKRVQLTAACTHRQRTLTIKGSLFTL